MIWEHCFTYPRLSEKWWVFDFQWKLFCWFKFIWLSRLFDLEGFWFDLMMNRRWLLKNYILNIVRRRRWFISWGTMMILGSLMELWLHPMLQNTWELRGLGSLARSWLIYLLPYLHQMMLGLLNGNAKSSFCRWHRGPG